MRRLLVTALLLAVVFATVHATQWLLGTLFEPLHHQGIDRLFRLRSGFETLRPPYDGTVLLVPIDDDSVEVFEDFYVGRAAQAQLVRALGRAEAAAQFHDMVFAAELDETLDEELAAATRDAGNAYYGMAVGLSTGGRTIRLPDPGRDAVLDRLRWHPDVRGDPSAIPRATSHYTTISRLSAASRGMAFLDVVPDGDGVLRRTHLLVRDGDGFLPSIALQLVADYLGVDPARVVIRPGRSILLPGARAPGASSSRDIRIPIDREGRMTVNYIGAWGHLATYPFLGVYEAEGDRFAMADLREELRGRIAIVAFFATGAGDTGPVPTDADYPKPGIHANAVNTILSGAFLHELSAPAMILGVELPLLLLLLWLSLRYSTVPFIAAGVALVVLYAVLVAVAFLFAGVVLRVPGPPMLIVGATLVLAAYHYHLESQARAVLRTTFESYFPPSVVTKIMDHSEDLIAAAQKKELTILFSDVKGFTSHTSTMEAGHVRKLLNEYFEIMIETVFRHEGTLDKFIGDGLMVFFGDPQPQPDHASRCVRAAIEMQQAARELHRVWAARGDMPLEIRVGINTGEVIVGNMGSGRRLSYTVLGEPVNLAQRLEASAPVGGILISKRTWELLGGAIETRALEPIRVKGIDRPIEVYEVPVPPD